MQIKHIALEFRVSGRAATLSGQLDLPIAEGPDWYSVILIEDVIHSQKFYGTSYLEALLNAINFLTEITTEPIPRLVRKLSIGDTEKLSVIYRPSE